jgi:hypothetical protein
MFLLDDPIKAGFPIGTRICRGRVAEPQVSIALQVEIVAMAKSPGVRGCEVPMAKFYIHFRYDNTVDHDDVGIDLPSLEKAREVALLSFRELLAENIYSNWKTPVMAAIITDGNGRELMVIPVQDVLPDPLKK